MVEQNKVSVCKLCGVTTTLRLSHIYPKFILRWLKQTGTGLLRSGENLNVRVQDGFKCYMLCQQCEIKFGKLEDYFAKNIFHPIVNNETSDFRYDDRLFKFVVSIMWRLLHFSMLDDSDRSEYFQSMVLRAEEKWRKYLLDLEGLDEFDSLHLLVGVDVVKEESLVTPERMIMYMARYLDAGITDDNIDYCVGFIKLPRFFFLIPLSGFDNSAVFNTEIFKEGGHYITTDAIVQDATWGNLLLDRVNQFEREINSIKPSQRQKMFDVGIEKWNQFKDKDLGDIIKYQNGDD